MKRDWIIIDQRYAPRGLALKFEDIKREVAFKHGFTVEALEGKSRRRDVVYARHEAMYWGLARTPHSSTEIGRRLGGRHHATVLYGAAMFAARNDLPPVSKFSLDRHITNLARSQTRAAA